MPKSLDQHVAELLGDAMLKYAKAMTENGFLRQRVDELEGVVSKLREQLEPRE